MAEQHTPTTEEVRERFIDGFPMETWLVSREQCGQDFDAWLAAHDAQVLRDAAERLEARFPDHWVTTGTLRSEADRIAGGTSDA